MIPVIDFERVIKVHVSEDCSHNWMNSKGTVNFSNKQFIAIKRNNGYYTILFECDDQPHIFLYTYDIEDCFITELKKNTDTKNLSNNISIPNNNDIYLQYISDLRKVARLHD